MNDTDARQAAEKLAQSIKRAQEYLAASDAKLAQEGFSSRREAQEFLESQLSAHDIADVNAEVAQEVRRIQDDINTSRLHSAQPRRAVAGKRGGRQMI